MKLPTTRAGALIKRLRTAAHVNGVNLDIVEGHTIECRFYINTVWLVDGKRRSVVDTLAFVNELFNPEK